MPPLDDTIAAIATAPGVAGLAVLRVSGARALAVADAVFRGAIRLADAASHTVHHGWAVRPADRDVPVSGRIDEVLATVFRAPRSYTCEDVVELSCHGGGLSARRLLAALLAAGARLAHPGEFTLREDPRVKTYAIGDGLIKKLAVAPADQPEASRETS